MWVLPPTLSSILCPRGMLTHQLARLCLICPPPTTTGHTPGLDSLLAYPQAVTGCVLHTPAAPSTGALGAPSHFLPKAGGCLGGCLLLTGRFQAMHSSHPAKHRLPRGGSPSSPRCRGCIDFASSAALQWRQRGRHAWPAGRNLIRHAEGQGSREKSDERRRASLSAGRANPDTPEGNKTQTRLFRSGSECQNSGVVLSDGPKAEIKWRDGERTRKRWKGKGASSPQLQR